MSTVLWLFCCLSSRQTPTQSACVPPFVDFKFNWRFERILSRSSGPSDKWSVSVFAASRCCGCRPCCGCFAVYHHLRPVSSVVFVSPLGGVYMATSSLRSQSHSFTLSVSFVQNPCCLLLFLRLFTRTSFGQHLCGFVASPSHVVSVVTPYPDFGFRRRRVSCNTVCFACVSVARGSPQNFHTSTPHCVTVVSCYFCSVPVCVSAVVLVVQYTCAVFCCEGYTIIIDHGCFVDLVAVSFSYFGVGQFVPFVQDLVLCPMGQKRK